MTIGEKIYTAIVILFAALLLFVFGIFYFMILPQAENANVFKFLMFIYAFFFVFFGVTATMNLVKKQLLLIPTIVQSLMLMLTILGIPPGIWGIYLLYQRYRSKEEKVELEDRD